MKPCSQHKKQIALRAARSLPAPEALRLQEHLNRCPGCREYWEEVSRLCEEHFSMAAELPSARADDRFHERLAARIKTGESGQAIRRILRAAWTLAPGRLALAAGTTLLAAALLVIFLRPREQVAPPTASLTRSGIVPKLTEKASPPTLMKYRLAAGKSLEELDALLAGDAERFLPPTPLLTASARRGLELAE